MNKSEQKLIAESNNRKENKMEYTYRQKEVLDCAHEINQFIINQISKYKLSDKEIIEMLDETKSFQRYLNDTAKL